MKIRLYLGVLLALFMLAFQVSAAYHIASSDLEIASVSSASGNPGSAVTITANLTNSGATDIAAIQFTSTALANGANSIPAPVITDMLNLLASTSQEKTFSITLPSVPAGTYTGLLAVNDRNDPENTDNETYTVTVSSFDDFSLSASSLKISGQADTASTGTFTIANTGSTPLAFTLSADQIEDSDDDPISVLFSSLGQILPGQSAEVTVTADIDNMVDVGEYDGTITVKSGVIEKNITLMVDVQPDICEDGISGDLEVSINDPDDNDEFEPGDTIPLKVGVENHYSKDLDVLVEVILYDTTEGKKIASATSQEEEINDGDSETFDVELQVPTSDFDEDDTFYIYAKAYKRNDEDEQCNFDRIKVRLNRGEDNVIVRSFKLDPSTATCGQKVRAIVDVENIGTEDQDDVYIELKSRSLSLEMESIKFELQEYSDVKTRHTEIFEFVVPGNADIGENMIEAIVNFADDMSAKAALLAVSGCENPIPTDAKISMKAAEDKITVQPGIRKFIIPLIIENTGGSAAKFRVDVTETAGWADVTSIETPESLNGGESYHAYVYMELKGDVAVGVHNLRVNLKDDAGVLASKMIGIDVRGIEAVPDIQTPEELKFLDSLLNSKGKMFWLIGDAVLVLVALIFIMMLLRR